MVLMAIIKAQGTVQMSRLQPGVSQTEPIKSVVISYYGSE